MCHTLFYSDATQCSEPCGSCQSADARMYTFLFFTPEVRNLFCIVLGWLFQAPFASFLFYTLLLPQHAVYKTSFCLLVTFYFRAQFSFIVILLSECLLLPVMICTNPFPFFFVHLMLHVLA